MVHRGRMETMEAEGIRKELGPSVWIGFSTAATDDVVLTRRAA